MQTIKNFFLSLAGKLTWYQWILLALAGIISWCLALWLIRYWHRRREAKDLVHLKITLPRNDSKLDNEKRTEKDFHEQIGKAEQLFRALHETRDMNLYNVFIKRMLWGKPMISFELQFEKRQLYFVVVCDPYYQKIIQKQITSFYYSAEVEVIKPEDRFTLEEKGHRSNGFFMFLKRSYWYPIQTYKQIEDDPLNIVSNAFSKLSKDEKAAVQLVVHPIAKGWQKKGKRSPGSIFRSLGRSFRCCGIRSKSFSVDMIPRLMGGPMLLEPVEEITTYGCCNQMKKSPNRSGKNPSSLDFTVWCG